MPRFIKLIVLLGVAVMSLAGCTTTKTAPDGFFETREEDSPAKESKLVAGDSFELSVEVDGNMEVAMHRAKVDSRGMATLPLVGDLKVAGLKLEDVREIIAAKYGGYYVNPPVIILSSIEEDEVSEWGNVTVLGRVNQPGMVALTSARGINLSAAVQQAGGFSASAKTGDIRVSRTDSDGKKIQVSVDFNQIGQQGDIAADLKLMDGDIVYVPERIF